MIRLFLLILIISFITCNSSEEELQILIETDRSEYLVNEDIQVSISNLSEKNASYFRCDNVELSPSYMIRFDGIQRHEEKQTFICTFMGPSGFIGSLESGTTESDLISLDKRGMYQLRYEFEIEGTRRYFDSNIFTVR